MTVTKCTVCHANAERLLGRQPTAFHASVQECATCHVEHQRASIRPRVMDHIERFGSGLNIWFYTEGDEVSRAEVKSIAENQSQGTAVLFPRPKDKNLAGPGFEHVELTGQGIDHARKILEDYFEAKLRTFIIGQNLSSGTASTGLGSGVADLHTDTKADIIRCDALNLADARLVRFVARLRGHP